MTYEEFEDKLQSAAVYLDTPIAQWYMLVENEEYDPEGFNQKIEDSEEYSPFYYDDFINFKGCMTLSDNSDEWQTNHRKICPIKAYSFVNTTCDGERVVNHKFLYNNNTKKCLLKAFKQIEEKGLNVVGCTYGDIRDEEFFAKVNKKK